MVLEEHQISNISRKTVKVDAITAKMSWLIKTERGIQIYNDIPTCNIRGKSENITF